MNSIVMISTWEATSLKFVRKRLPASVSVATQPSSALTEKGDNSKSSSSSSWATESFRITPPQRRDTTAYLLSFRFFMSWFGFSHIGFQPSHNRSPCHPVGTGRRRRGGPRERAKGHSALGVVCSVSTSRAEGVLEYYRRRPFCQGSHLTTSRTLSRPCRQPSPY